MPNRIIKETICTSETIDVLSEGAENFFYRLLVHCDDNGLMDARPSILRAKLYPLRIETVTDSIVAQRLDECAAAGLINLYQSDGRAYLSLRTWTKHQRLNHTRAIYPLPPPLAANGGQPPPGQELASTQAAGGGLKRIESESESESESDSLG